MEINAKNSIVTIHTNLGDIKVELYNDKAPITTQNFLDYITEGFYNDTIFHRVISNFMIQGGGLISGLEQKPNDKLPIQNEANNGLSNVKGTIAMARTQDPHSATSQFFINVNDNNFLDFKSETVQGWGYTVFGRVIAGMDIVDQIKTSKTTSVKYYDDVPVEDIVIQSIEINDE